MVNEPLDDTPPRGFEALVDALAAEDFPMDKQGLAYSVGDLEIEDGRGGFVPIRIVLEGLDRDVFPSCDAAVRAIRAALPRAAGRGA